MHEYMKELKKKIKTILIDAGIVIDHIKVRENKLVVYLPKESMLKDAYALMPSIRDMIDADGAGYKSNFDGLTDTWSIRKGYLNTRGIEAEVSFHGMKYGV